MANTSRDVVWCDVMSVNMYENKLAVVIHGCNLILREPKVTGHCRSNA
jgi:hypothetical protein